MIKKPLIFILSLFVLNSFLVTVSAQIFDQKKANELNSLHKVCLDINAPVGSAKQQSPWHYDVVKEKCLCFSSAIIDKYYPNINESFASIEADAQKVAAYCENKVNLRREIETRDESMRNRR